MIFDEDAAAGRERGVHLAHELAVRRLVLGVNDVREERDVEAARQRVATVVTRDEADAVLEAAVGEVAARDVERGGEIEDRDLEVRMAAAELDGIRPRPRADVQHAPCAGEVERLGEHARVAARLDETRHRVDEERVSSGVR